MLTAANMVTHSALYVKNACSAEWFSSAMYQAMGRSAQSRYVPSRFTSGLPPDAQP